MKKIWGFIKCSSGTFIAIILFVALITIVFFILHNDTASPSDTAKSLGLIIGLASLAIGIFKDSLSREEKNFHTALVNVGEKDSTVRTLSIGMLKTYLTCSSRNSLYMLFGNQLMVERPRIVAEGLANNLAKETDEYVGEVCIRALHEAHASLHQTILETLCDNNRTLWKQRNRKSAKAYHDTLTIENKNEEDANRAAEQISFYFEAPLSLTRKAIVRFLRTKDKQSSFGRNVRNPVFKGVHLDYADFSCADLSYCDFTGATLTHVNFKQAILTGAKFDRAIILNSYFSKTDIQNTSFNGAVLGCCHFHKLRKGEKKPSPNTMKEALLVVGNKYTEEIGDTREDITWRFYAEKELPQGKNKSIYLTHEFDWRTIWKPEESKGIGEDEPACFDAVQYSPLSKNLVITMGFRYTHRTRQEQEKEKEKEKEKDIIERFRSSDGHNGYYVVTDRVEIRPAHMWYIAGYRVLSGDEHRWEGVYWNLSGPNEKKTIHSASSDDKS